MDNEIDRPWVTTLAEGLEPGSRLEDHYRQRHGALRNAGRFVRLIQEGGMGAVLEVEAGGGGTPWRLAVKLLKPRWLEQAAAIDRFRREMASHRRLSETLQATRLVPCLAFHDNEDPARVFGLFPYYPEGSLQGKLREGIGVGEALLILSDAVEGLQSLHGHRYLHRDLHPHNVLLEREGGRLRGVLGDLGVGMFLEPNTIFSAEQLRHDRDHRAGHPGFIDPWSMASTQADLYSAGVTLYRILVGQLPGQSGSRLGLPLPEEWVHGLDPAVREWGNEVLLRLTSPDRCERYASAREARQGIVTLAELALASEPSASLAPVGQQSGTFVAAGPSTNRGSGSAPPQDPLPRDLACQPLAPATVLPSAIASTRLLPARSRGRLAGIGVILGLFSGLPFAWWFAPQLAAARLEFAESFSLPAKVDGSGQLPNPQTPVTQDSGGEPPTTVQRLATGSAHSPLVRSSKVLGESIDPQPSAVAPADPAAVLAAWERRDLAALRRLATAHPGDPEVTSRLALLLSRRGPEGLEEASDRLEAAISRFPARGELRLTLARIRMQQESVGAAQRVLASTPEGASHRQEIAALLVTISRMANLQPRMDEET